MVRVTAIAILAFAASALAAPQGSGRGDDRILDFNGQPLSGDKEAQFLELDKQGEQKFKELTGSFTPQQQQIDEELRKIGGQQDDILGVPEDERF